MVFVLCALIDSMGSLCSRHRHSPADPEENEQVNGFYNFQIC